MDVCATFGHTWTVKASAGGPVLVCSTCKTTEENR